MRFGPSRGGATAAGAGALIAAGLAVAAAERPGRLLFALAALALLLVAGNDLWSYPRLIVTAVGLTVRSPARTAILPWSQIQAVRVDERTRLGLAARTLEIDLGADLLVFGRRSLGTDPRDVAAIIAGFRGPITPP